MDWNLKRHHHTHLQQQQIVSLLLQLLCQLHAVKQALRGAVCWDYREIIYLGSADASLWLLLLLCTGQSSSVLGCYGVGCRSSLVHRTQKIIQLCLDSLNLCEGRWLRSSKVIVFSPVWIFLFPISTHSQNSRNRFGHLPESLHDRSKLSRFQSLQISVFNSFSLQLINSLMWTP